MKLYIAGAALLLPLLLSGCVHKQNVAQNQPLAPPIEDTPPPKPDNAPINLPAPVVTVPSPPPPTVTNTPPPPPPKPKPTRHKPKPAQPAAQPADQQPTQEASNNPPPAPEVSAGGSFSSPGPGDLRRETGDTINETERGLNSITRQLSDQEKKTSTQIREFLKEAKAALTTGDVDGAHTLAQKAKVLLAELTQP